MCVSSLIVFFLVLFYSLSSLLLFLLFFLFIYVIPFFFLLYLIFLSYFSFFFIKIKTTSCLRDLLLTAFVYFLSRFSFLYLFKFLCFLRLSFSSVRMYQSGANRMGFREIWFSSLLWKSVEKSVKNISHFTSTSECILLLPVKSICPGRFYSATFNVFTLLTVTHMPALHTEPIVFHCNKAPQYYIVRTFPNVFLMSDASQSLVL